MNPRRPMPDDFADMAAKMASRALQHHYGAAPSTVTRWRSELADGQDSAAPVVLRPMPEDFAEHAHERNLDLTQRYKCGTRSLARWRAALGVVMHSPHEPVPVPAGFRLVAPEHTRKELRERYGRSDRIIARWLGQEGVTCRRPDRPAPPSPAKKSAAPERRKFQMTPLAIKRDHSRAGQAADYLRKFGPITRCNADGRFDPEGDHWRRGSSILSAEDIVARAIAKGWQPEGWRRVA
jgi:hypothetical protein